MCERDRRAKQVRSISQYMGLLRCRDFCPLSDIQQANVGVMVCVHCPQLLTFSASAVSPLFMGSACTRPTPIAIYYLCPPTQNQFLISTRQQEIIYSTYKVLFLLRTGRGFLFITYSTTSTTQQYEYAAVMSMLSNKVIALKRYYMGFRAVFLAERK